jgi:capsule polysaccharide modification protein KpsS
LEFSPEFVKEFLAKLEVYASSCYIQTQKHILAAKQLKNLEDILNYDYTTGYPEKITLE